MSPSGNGTDNGADRYSFSYPSDESDQPTSAIVEAMAWVKGVDVVHLEPLSDAVDPDALNALFGRRPIRGPVEAAAAGPSPDDLEVEFEYAGYVVTVDADVITVQPA